MFTKSVRFVVFILCWLSFLAQHGDSAGPKPEATEKKNQVTLKEVWSKKGIGAVVSLAVSGDGKWLATASRDYKVMIWELASGKEKTSLQALEKVENQLAFEPKGTKLVSGGILGLGDKTLKMWDVTLERELFSTKPHHLLRSFAFHPEGHTLVVSGNDKGRAGILLLDSRTGEIKKEFSTRISVRSLTFSPDGKLLVGAGGTAAQGVIRVWDADLGKELQPLLTTEDFVVRIRFSPCGKWIVCAERNKLIRMLEPTGKEVREFPRPNAPLHDLAYSPDGKLLAGVFGGTDSQVIFWNPGTGEVITALDLPYVAMIAFAPDSKKLICSGGFSGFQVYDLSLDNK